MRYARGFVLSVPARACATDSSSWKSTYFQKIFRKKLQKDRCFRRINSQYEDSDKKLIKLNKSRRWYVDNDIGRSYKKRKETLFFFFFFFLPPFFLLNFCFFYIFVYIVEACIYIYDNWKLRTFHALIKKFVLFVLSTKLLDRYPMLDTISYLPFLLFLIFLSFPPFLRFYRRFLVFSLAGYMKNP